MLVFIADDDILCVRLVKCLLELSGYQVMTAYRSSEILPGIQQHNPDLLLLDVAMPITSGFDICRQIRRYSNIPIIFLSAHVHMGDRLAGIRAGGDDYIVKPFDLDELLTRMQSVLRRARGSAPGEAEPADEIETER